MKRNWKLSLLAFVTGLGLGLVLFLCVSFVVGLFSSQRQTTTRRESAGVPTCDPGRGFASPEEIVAALTHGDVTVRRDAFDRLLLRPGAVTNFFDYERDRGYPERAERAGVKYVNLDGGGGDEAVLTFVRYENPAALILKKDGCVWSLAAALSSWLRFDDYPYESWLETPGTGPGGAHDILLRESTGDATRYARNVRLLRLTGGPLAEVASFTEESIRPVKGYRGADWADVKVREATRYSFLPPADGRPPRLRLETVEEVVKYSGEPPAYTFWLEVDGAWHTAVRHWKARASGRVRLLGERTRDLVWDDRLNRFAEEK